MLIRIKQPQIREQQRRKLQFLGDRHFPTYAETKHTSETAIL